MHILRIFLVILAVVGLIAGLVAGQFGATGTQNLIHLIATLPILAVLLYEIITSLMRREVGLDVVAALSMAAALLFGESLAANVVGLMYAGGELLEAYAEGRARKEMTALLKRVAHTAMRYTGTELKEVPTEALAIGDRLLIRSGETVPVDGEVGESQTAVLDESALTGESLPQTRSGTDAVLSGSTNAGAAFDLVVSRPAKESTYARIVALVEAAQTAKSPVGRLADRMAMAFLGLTLLLAGLAWGLSGDPIRALSVLVVATPCPLILALPVALISGMSRVARQGVLVKTSAALEHLWRVKTVILDKTGTLTRGQAEVREIRTVPGRSADEVLGLAASLDQASNHVIAEALVREAKRRGLELKAPNSVVEEAGAGLTGWVGETQVVLGGGHYVAERSQGRPGDLRNGLDGETAVVAVAIDGHLAGIIALADPIRPEAPDVVAGLREAGISRIVLASGDRQDVVDAVASKLHVDVAKGELSPSDKLALVARESDAAPTAMIGDGVNDAPALAAASLGIAMGARGSAASSETADIVILVDRLDRVLDAKRVADRTKRIALESVYVGLGLSLVGMVAAAFGMLPPISGALAQEAIDVAVILNALRALR